jgi:CheY-specific phosphatase CheX
MNKQVVLVAGQEEALRLVVTEACVDMLTACGTPVGHIAAERDVAPRDHDIAGMIGFTGPIHGSLIIAAPPELFESTLRASAIDGPPLSLPDLLDWAGELANQTLGRIKRRFCERGVDFQTSTPTAISAQQIENGGGRQEALVGLLLTVKEGLVSVSFDVAPPQDGDLFRDQAQPIPCALEGDLVLF